MKIIKLMICMMFLSLLAAGNITLSTGTSTREDSTRLNLENRAIPRMANPIFPNDIYPSSTNNYVLEKIYLDPTSSNSSARSVFNITYLDGFGRKLQEIQVHGSPGGTSDIVLPHQYGVQGRVEREYLPYASGDNHGKFVTDAFNSNKWKDYGIAESPYTYTLTKYDNSPLERVLKQTGPGRFWHEKKKGVTTSYGMNGANEVRLYRVSGDGMLTLSGYYAAGSLQKVTTIDEDSCLVVNFTDNDDRVVLVVSVESGTSRLETYSVYDNRRLLRYVLSPEASARVGNPVNVTELNRFAYRYDYDRWGRMIVKRLPGCDPVYLVYDNRDRLVMSQDGKQRAENVLKWSYSLYDNQNRVVETGEVVLTGTANTHAGLQEAASGSDNYIPVGTRVVFRYTLYDTYKATVSIPVHAFVPVTGYATGYHPHVTGLVTSTKTRVLETGTYLTTTTYYDDRCRVIQATSDNLQGQKSRVDVGYDFTGNIVRQRESHSTSAGKMDVLESVNSYDGRGRLLTSTITLNGGTLATVSCGYDAIGRLVSQKQGNVTETLAYNTRGWLTSKESVPFKMKLRYESPLGTPNLARYNGNVSEWEWQHGTSAALMYGFTYDKLNRLAGATQKQKSGTTWGDLAGHYLEKGITYDRNGNIKTLQRTAGGTTVDNLVYSCTGNQVTGLSENIQTTPTGDIYSPGGVVAGTYTYDKNGNMKSDSRKVLNFNYNVLNLLSEVKTENTTKAKYFYLADGTKLRVRDAGVNGFDYLGSLTYRNGSAGLQLESANFGSGVIRVNASNSALQEVNYFLTDHLGSVRVIVDGSGTVKERNDYYPLGARHVRSDYPKNDNRLLYNGKEEQTTGDLDYLDYGSRMYDSGLGRWFSMDPKSEDYYFQSCYLYCNGNPIRFIDPNGEDGWDVIIGILLAILENMKPGEKVNLVDNYNDFEDARDFEIGLVIGDYASVIVGGIEIIYGAWNIAEGGSMMGLGAIAAGPSMGLSTVYVAGGSAAVAVGVASAMEGFVTMSNGTKNLKNKRKVSSAESKYKKEAEHTKNSSESNRNDHEYGQSRKKQDKGNEKADARRKRYK